MVLDQNDLPVFQGFTNVTFSFEISKAAVESNQPRRVIQYGHGLFGSQVRCYPPRAWLGGELFALYRTVSSN